MWTVYKHICPNGKVYIGITKHKNPNQRWVNGKGYSNCPYFNNAINKFKWDNITHVIVLENVTKSEDIYTEKYLIKWYKLQKMCYNLADGGEGVTGIKFTEERKKYINEKLMGIKRGPMKEKTKETLAKIFSKPIVQIDSETLEIIAEYPSIKQAAIQIGKNGKENNIAHVLHGRNSKAFGYIWKFRKK